MGLGWELCPPSQAGPPWHHQLPVSCLPPQHPALLPAIRKGPQPQSPTGSEKKPPWITNSNEKTLISLPFLFLQAMPELCPEQQHLPCPGAQGTLRVGPHEAEGSPGERGRCSQPEGAGAAPAPALTSLTQGTFRSQLPVLTHFLFAALQTHRVWEGPGQKLTVPPNSPDPKAALEGPVQQSPHPVLASKGPGLEGCLGCGKTADKLQMLL